MHIRLRPLILAAAAAVLAAPLPAQTGFVVEYPPVQEASAARMRESLLASGRFERLSRGLNGWIRMSRQVTLRPVECTSSDIRWNGEDHAVELCYRMLTRLGGITAGKDSLVHAMINAHFFMTLHGVAHALVDELDLAVGPEPEAGIDELTALLLMAGAGEDGSVSILQGIVTLQRADPRWGEWAYATEHGLQPARFQNVACLVYGINPDRFDGCARRGCWPPAANSAAAPREPGC
jgi:Putative metallopeptidase